MRLTWRFLVALARDVALDQSDATASRQYRIFASAGRVSLDESLDGVLFAEIDSLASSFGVGNCQRNVSTGSITTIQQHGGAERPGIEIFWLGVEAAQPQLECQTSMVPKALRAASPWGLHLWIDNVSPRDCRNRALDRPDRNPNPRAVYLSLGESACYRQAGRLQIVSVFRNR